jgi:hypothetical protein
MCSYDCQLSLIYNKFVRVRVTNWEKTQNRIGGFETYLYNLVTMQGHVDVGADCLV